MTTTDQLTGVSTMQTLRPFSAAGRSGRGFLLWMMIPLPLLLASCSSTIYDNRPFKVMIADPEHMLSDCEIQHVKAFVESRYPSVTIPDQWEKGNLLVLMAPSDGGCYLGFFYFGSLGEDGLVRVFPDLHRFLSGDPVVGVSNTTVHEIGHYLGYRHNDIPTDCMQGVTPDWIHQTTECVKWPL